MLYLATNKNNNKKKQSNSSKTFSTENGLLVVGIEKLLFNENTKLHII